MNSRKAKRKKDKEKKGREIKEMKKDNGKVRRDFGSDWRRERNTHTHTQIKR